VKQVPQSKDDIFERVVAVLRNSFGFEPSEILPSSHLIDDLDLDSIDAIDMAVELEQEIGLDVGEDELRELRVVGDIVDLVYRNLGGA
jgi:acyl carrier protein